MLRLIVLTLMLASGIKGRVFNNPVLNKNYADPGAIKIDGTYYVVTTGGNPTISASTDLINWKTVGYLFDDSDRPSWLNGTIWAPEIVKFGDKYNAYFSSSAAGSDLEIGVAVADALEGPYKPLPAGTLFPSSYDPTVLQTEGGGFLVWSVGKAIKGQYVGSNGIDVVSGDTYELIINDLEWEGGVVEAPSIFKRGDYFYILYTGSQSCNDARSIGVARSHSETGPYEKLGAPILKTNTAFTEPAHCSLVKDLNDQDDILVFHAHLKGENCGPFNTLLASVGWGSDNWPYIFDF